MPDGQALCRIDQVEQDCGASIWRLFVEPVKLLLGAAIKIRPAQRSLANPI